MKYWRLYIQTESNLDELFDLREVSNFEIGDDWANDYSITTTDVPSKFKVIYKKNDRIFLRLTNEIKESLEGQYLERTTWKSQLYSGSTYEITGNTSFKIGETIFEIRQVEERKLAPMPITMDPLARANMQRSITYGVGGHVALFLFLFVSGLLYFWITHEYMDDEIKIEKVAVINPEKIFQTTPTPVSETPQDISKPKKQKPLKNVAQKVAKKNMRKAKVAKAKGIQRKGGAVPKKRNVKDLGLLAIQTNISGSASHTVKVSAPATNSNKVSVAALAPGIGTTDGSFGLLHDSKSLSNIGSLSGKTYTGEVGESVQARRGPSIQLVRKEIVVKGGLEPAVVRQIIEERLSEVRYCYEVALLKTENIRGKIDASWVISSNGQVTGLSSSSSEIDQAVLHPCLKKQIAKWKFPKPKGGGIVRVKYPFVFSPMGG